MSFKSKGIAGAAVLLVIYGGFNLEKRLKPGQVVHSQGTGRSLARSQPIPRASLRLPPRAFVPRDEYESPIIANSEELAVFTAFDRWCERYENGDGKTTQLVSEGEKIALQRQARLAELIVTDPEAAL